MTYTDDPFQPETVEEEIVHLQHSLNNSDTTAEAQLIQYLMQAYHEEHEQTLLQARQRILQTKNILSHASSKQPLDDTSNSINNIVSPIDIGTWQKVRKRSMTTIIGTSLVPYATLADANVKKVSGRFLNVFVATIIIAFLIGSTAAILPYIKSHQSKPATKGTPAITAHQSNDPFLNTGWSIVKLNPSSGDQIWAFTPPEQITTTGNGQALLPPATTRMLVQDQTIYTTAQQTGVENVQRVYAINTANEIVQWSTTIFERSSKTPLFVHKNLLYVSGNQNVFALDIKTGAILHTYPITDTNNSPCSVPSINFITGEIAPDPNIPIQLIDIQVTNTSLYVSCKNQLTAYNLSNGNQIWHFTAPEGQFAHTIAVHSDTVYATYSQFVQYLNDSNNASYTGSIYAFDATTGAKRWQTAPIKGFNLESTLDKDSIYVTAPNQAVLAYNASNGDKLWQKNIPFVKHAPIVIDKIVSVMTLTAQPEKSIWEGPLSVIGLDSQNGQQLWATVVIENVYSIDICWRVNDILLINHDAESQFTAIDTTNGKKLWTEKYQTIV